MELGKVGVVGTGAWGTALALVAQRAGCEVVLWARTAEAAAEIARDRENRRRLPGIPLPDGIAVTSQDSALAGCATLIIATPAQAMRDVMTALAPQVPAQARLIIAAKGIERASGWFLADVLDQILPRREVMVISGPSFAAEVARDLPTAVTLAASSIEAARPVGEMLSQPTFRIYLSDDLVGVQIGGAVKNVLAIACGIVDGRGLGESARAALIARAFAELSRLAGQLGARPETLAGLCGLGDLVLTCSSLQSRNFSFGYALGQGKSLEDANASSRGVSEGTYTASAAAAIARESQVEMPICAAILAVLEGRASIEEAISGLMHRPIKPE